mmetsp:Transcript_4718/g.11001  ORF Transcript_4718/g.11001 Transcript_4718/m.11001 type:complete len:267 (-) Transcript_4718:35-835(-)
MDASRATQSDQTQKAPAFVDMMPSKANCGDMSTAAYNDLIRNFVRSGNLQVGEALLGNMENFGVAPDAVSFNLILNSYATIGEVHKAEALLDAMCKRNIEPNDVTYATVCKVMAFNGQVGQIEVLMEMLRQRNIRLNVYFYGALISACGRCEPPDILTAERTFSQLVEMGLRPQSVKRCLARAVGVTRASVLISRACQRKATSKESTAVEAKSMWDSGNRSHAHSPSAARDFPSPIAVCGFRATSMGQTLGQTFCGESTEIIRLSV